MPSGRRPSAASWVRAIGLSALAAVASACAVRGAVDSARLKCEQAEWTLESTQVVEGGSMARTRLVPADAVVVKE